MKYYYTATDLETAVSLAVTGTKRFSEERNNGGRCRQLARWIDQLASEAGDLENRIDNFERELDRLASSRSANLSAAALSAAAAAAGLLGSAGRAAQTVRRSLRGGRVSFADVASAIPYVGGGLAAAISGLSAYRDGQ